MNIPISSTSGYIGLALLALGGFMLLAGFDIISIQQVTVRQGRRTWAVGLVFALIGVGLLLPEFRSAQPASESQQPPEPAANVVEQGSSEGEVVEQGLSGGELQGSPIEFSIPDETIWLKSAEGSYTARGSVDTIAWSDVVVEGDLELRLDVTSPSPYGDANVVIYGNGRGLSEGNLFFGVARDVQKIMSDNPYNGRFLADAARLLAFEGQVYTIMIRIADREASLLVDGDKILSVFLTNEINSSGRIGLYKWSGSPQVTFSNIRLTASSTREP